MDSLSISSEKRILFQVLSTKLFIRFRDIFDDYVIGMKEAVEAEEGAKDK